jgi:thiosulfate/3-mercaptopyruvate sulfurtransferase
VGPLVDVEWLREHLGEPGLAVVDCRWKLGEPGAGRRLYEEGHIPGAGFMDVDADLSAPPGDGRHPLPDEAAFATAAASAGVSVGTRVVAYDEAGEGGAARLWWLLRHFGHPRAAVLDGGLRRWRVAGGELSSEEPPLVARLLPLYPSDDDVILAEEIERRLDDGSLDLVDARSAERYRGEVEPIDPVAGHIPGARNVPFAELAPDGRYLPPEELRKRLEGEGELVAYCGSGVTSAHVVLAAEVAGLPEPRLYPGSWSQWCGRGLPAETS